MEASELRARLGRARLMLVFTPAVAADPLAALEAALPWVDAIQVRVKAAGQPGAWARETHAWCLRVLDRVHASRQDPLVLVDDRVDVAAVLARRGVAGVHLGTDDLPPEEARAILGAGALVGLSTHDARQVARSLERPVDYLGFGPVFATATKGYEQGHGPEEAWIAHAAATVPVFPIGGIDPSNAEELGPIGRAAVASAILAARDPGAAAREIRRALGG